VVRDALERGAREGRARLDDVRTSRRRHDALADLGELVLDLIRRGEIDLAELPEARDLVRLFDEFDAESEENDDPAPDPRRFATRRRFDDRPPTRPPPIAPRPMASSSSSSSRSSSSPPSSSPSSSRSSSPSSSSRSSSSSPSSSPSRFPPSPSRSMPSSSRPPLSSSRATPSHRDDADDDIDDDRAVEHDVDHHSRHPTQDHDQTAPSPRRFDTNSDGTVSSGLSDRTMRPTVPALPKHAESPSTRAPTKPIKGIWRPQIDDLPAVADHPDPPRSPPPRDPSRKGGITFDDDDLSDYMHPDDVPPKPPSRDPGDADP
jgi:hypothetical protein